MDCSNDGAFVPENLVEHEATRNLIQTLHRLATGGYRQPTKPSAVLRSHPLPSGGQRYIKPPPSGERWLPLPIVAIRCQAVDGAISNLHRLASGGYRCPT
jgi:hypothetical protein